MRVEDSAHVPREGGVIVAANHISFFDSVALLQSIPRRAFFIGKAEYMDSWTTRRLFPAMGLIPIEREQARKAMAALEVAADVLRRGDALGIYPEGTRSRDGLLHKGHTGVAQLAMMSGAPIVPVGLVGTEHIQPIGARVPRPFRRAVVRFGTPLDPAAYGGSPRRRRQLLTDDLMEAIRRLSGQDVERRLLRRRRRRSCAAATRASTRCTPSAVWARRGPRRPASPSAACAATSPTAGSATVRRLGCRVMPDGAVRFATEVDGVREVPTRQFPDPQEAAVP